MAKTKAKKQPSKAPSKAPVALAPIDRAGSTFSDSVPMRSPQANIYPEAALYPGDPDVMAGATPND
jgi:hypothetical protein